MSNQVTIFDTTLRDGTQGEGISLSVEDKLKIARKLDELGIRYIEGGWPGSNNKDIEFFQRCNQLDLQQAKITAFGSTRRKNTHAGDDPNLQKIVESGVTVATIFGKSWDFHVHKAIQTTLEENLNMIFDSIGVAPNKLLAKMASELKKPNGLTVLRRRDVPRMLWPKPCESLFGVGKRTAEKLAEMNIRTIGELAHTPDTELKDRFGIYGNYLKEAANGRDTSPVKVEREESKSVGHTTTLPYDFTEFSEIRQVFLNLADQVGRRLRKKKMMAETVQITIRNPQMKTITRAHTLEQPTEHSDVIYREACKLFQQHWQAGNPVRLLGITAQNLCVRSHYQLDLFDYPHAPKKEALNETMDRIRDKFGENSLLTAGMLGDEASASIRNRKIRGTSLQRDFFEE